MTTSAATITNLAGYGQVLLAAFTRALADLGVSLPSDDANKPISYCTSGQSIVLLSESLVVNFMGLRPGSAGAPSSGYLLPALYLTAAEYAVTLVRRAGGFGGEGYDFASATDLQGDFNVALADAAALWRAGLRIISDPSYGAQLDPGVPFTLIGLDAIDPQGGLSAQRLSLSVTVT